MGGTVNSRTTRRAPGFRTRWRSESPAGRSDKFRTPKPTVAPSKVSEGKGSRRESPHTGATGWPSTLSSPVTSMGWAKSEATTRPRKADRPVSSRARS